MILGDFNFHWEQHNDADKIHMQQLLDSAGLQQQVTGPTHTSGHCLDLVISRGPDNLITSTCVSSLLSDHHAIHCCLSLKKMPLPRKTVTYRKYKAIDHELFRKDLSLTPLIVSPATSLDELLMQYSTSLQDLINEHAPLKTKVTALRPSVPWFTADIAQAKRQCKKCAEKWRKTGLTVHREAYKHQRDYVNDLVAKAKKLHYNKQVEECPDQKALFRLLNTLLHRELKPQLPSNESLEELLQKFSDFFKSKISKIRLSLDSTPVDMSVFPLIPEFHPSSHLMSLQPLSEQEVIKLIKASPSKSCSLDPLPTFMLKEHVDLIAPAITSIINMSLSSAEVPLSMKTALVKPLLKKATLDPENLKNYRPVSNLTFLSKLTEKAVESQLSSHMTENNLYAPMQSAYREKYSVESALTKVQNDIMLAVDGSKGVLLVLLDLSAAFDTIDHELLLSKTESLGITGTALAWTKSYLSGRKQAIYIDGMSSSPTTLEYGVPQGSVKGPKDFTRYTREINSIADLYGVSIHLYADDTQLYLPFGLDSPTQMETAITVMEKCVKHIATWMIYNKLKLNEEKTEFVIICSPRQRHKLTFSSICIGDSVISATENARNLGVVFDQSMNMKTHITNMSRTTNYHLRSIGKISKYRSKSAIETLIHALITSRLDNNNVLLYGLPEKDINRLQRVLNNAARILTHTRKYDHITPVLKKLHWLPISLRIVFKILLITYKSLHGDAPTYLSDLLVPYIPSRALRSHKEGTLRIPKTKLVTFGDRAFSKAAPLLWNNLPETVRQAPSVGIFKSRLKTHLFSQF